MKLTYEEILASPLLFVTYILKRTPTRYQADFLEDENNRILVACGRKVGKTTMLGWKALWQAFVKPNQDIMILAPTFRQAKIVYDGIRVSVESTEFLKTHTKKMTQEELWFDNNSVIRCLTGGNKGEFARGFSSTMLIFDEAAYIPDEVFTAIIPAMAVIGETMILSSTPAGKRGYFYDTYSKNGLKKEWSVYHIRTTESELPSKEFIEEMRNTMTDGEFSQEADAEFLDEVGRYYPLELVLSNAVDYEYKLETPIGYDYFMGVDIARMGLDETAIIIVRREKTKEGDFMKVIWAETWSKLELTSIVGRILEIIKDVNVNTIFIDGIGLGIGVYDMLKERVVGTRLEAVVLEGKRRMDAYSSLKLMLEQKRIKLSRGDTKMLYQFGNYTAKYGTTGEMRIIKEISGRDDMVDALVLALQGMSSQMKVAVLEGFEFPRINVDKEMEKLAQKLYIEK